MLIVYASAAATGTLYESTADQVDAARAINDNPAVVALYGPILDVHSLGELAMTKVTVLYAVILALMFVVVVRRHTRSEEESGHAELLAGTAIGRDALLAAALVEGVALSRRRRRPGGCRGHRRWAAGRRVARCSVRPGWGPAWSRSR